MRKLAWFLWVALWILGGAAIMATLQEAHAQTPCPTGAVANDAARVCWTNALQLVNGDPIPASGPDALKWTRLRRSVCNADGSFGATVQTIDVLPAVGVVLFEGLPPAQHCFQARHVTNADALSDWTPVARKTTTAPAPPKPRQPNITVS